VASVTKTGATQHSPDETQHAHSTSWAIHNTDVLRVKDSKTNSVYCASQPSKVAQHDDVMHVTI
jgi:hypothetical protein